MKITPLTNTTLNEHANLRLDQAMAALFPDYSRSQHQTWIKENRVTVDGKSVNLTRFKVKPGQAIIIEPEFRAPVELSGENIPLSIVYEDEAILIVNKPAGLIVHPGAGNPNHTLVNALIHHAPALAQLTRAGLIHRLDKDTSGLLVVGKNPVAQLRLIRDLAKRKVSREYEAIVHGTMISGGTVDQPMGRHATQRLKMAIREDGQPAITHYRVVKKFPKQTHIRVMLETGRTHQIRVHMQHIKHPIVGDPTYGNRNPSPIDKQMARQALHAKKLGLTHPVTGEWMEFQCELPDDFRQLLALLEAPQ